MGVVDDLLRARAAYDRRDWLAAYGGLSEASARTSSPPTTSRRLATAAYLVGRRNDCVQALQRAYQLHVDSGDVLAAVRAAFWLALVLLNSGEAAVGGGWVGRAQRLLADVDGDVVERGYVLVHVMYRHIFAGEFAEALEPAEQVADYGRRFADPDLVAMGLNGAGSDPALRWTGPRRSRTAGRGDGRRRRRRGLPDLRGQRLLLHDRSLPGDRRLRPRGPVDLGPHHLVRRAAGPRAVHRPVRGAPRADHADARSVRRGTHRVRPGGRRYREANALDATGLAMAERGDVLRLRGDLADAAAAYDAAVSFGHEPQPGLALLWLAQGRIGGRGRGRASAARRDRATRCTVPACWRPPWRSWWPMDRPTTPRSWPPNSRSIATSFGCAPVQARAVPRLRCGGARHRRCRRRPAAAAPRAGCCGSDSARDTTRPAAPCCSDGRCGRSATNSRRSPNCPSLGGPSRSSALGPPSTRPPCSSGPPGRVG